MKRVDDLDDLQEAVALASAEAGAAFGDPRVYIERFVARGRHVEVQVLGDGRGEVIHLGERDCSVQRRYQKLIEETPAPGLSPTLRSSMHAAAVRFAKSLRYRGAGTVEFLVDVDRDEYYFLEMNARIQVEHPVTEAVTGIDLVEEQIAIAAGEGLRFQQSDIALNGSAIECRINAEDPTREFQPSPGRITTVAWPQMAGLRIDTHVRDGAWVPPYYDSLLAKVIVHGDDRATALDRLEQALAECRIDGVATNLALHRSVTADAGFRAGGVDTGFLEKFLSGLQKENTAHG
jgi:acetyl-CoA carboxylase biotin carboxylase subunit